VSGVVLHAGFVEQHLADEQVALENGAPVVGERGCRDAEVGLQRVHQHLRHRADVALRRAVEGGAVLEVDLLRALRLQPGQRFERLGDGVCGRDRARFQRDDHCVHFGVQGAVGHADRLHRPHAGAHQVVGQVGGAREVVGDAAEKNRFHGFLLGSSMPGKILITALSSSFA
jgi:hypothetical protein